MDLKHRSNIDTFIVIAVDRKIMKEKLETPAKYRSTSMPHGHTGDVETYIEGYQPTISSWLSTKSDDSPTIIGSSDRSTCSLPGMIIRARVCTGQKRKYSTRSRSFGETPEGNMV